MVVFMVIMSGLFVVLAIRPIYKRNMELMKDYHKELLDNMAKDTDERIKDEYINRSEEAFATRKQEERMKKLNERVDQIKKDIKNKNK